MSEIKSVLLIDDDAIITMYNESLIKKLNGTAKVHKSYNGKKAMQFLNERFAKNSSSLPEIILLDLYMPVMTGWEFLEEYQKLVEKPVNGQKLFIVSSTVCREEINKGLSNEFTTGFIEKPLTIEKIKDVLNHETVSDNILTASV